MSNVISLAEKVEAAAMRRGSPQPNEMQVAFNATGYECRDPSALPLRPWIYGNQFLRGTVSLVVAPGATGKSALLVGIALALATGRSLLGKDVKGGPKRVWLWNLEDSLQEMQRLVEAARKRWGITPPDIDGRLFVDSGLDGAELKIASSDRDGCHIVQSVVDALIAELRRREIDVLIVDPFVSSHSVSENDNGAMDAVAKAWAKVAVQANCAVVLAHHTRKLSGGEVNSEGARGAIALVSAARSVLALNRMSAEEAGSFGIQGDERRRYFRTYDDKNNRAPPAISSDWYFLASVNLGNGPDGHGDSIQVVEPWQPADPWEGVVQDDLHRLHQVIADGMWRADSQADDWIGYAFADLMGWDISDRKGREFRRTKDIIAEYVKNGALERVTADCPKSGKRKPFLVIGNAVEANSLTGKGHRN